MSVFHHPKGFCDDISRMLARFWWSSTNDTRKLHWMSWEKMCYPKELGGLNFRDLEEIGLEGPPQPKPFSFESFKGQILSRLIGDQC